MRFRRSLPRVRAPAARATASMAARRRVFAFAAVSHERPLPPAARRPQGANRTTRRSHRDAGANTPHSPEHRAGAAAMRAPCRLGGPPAVRLSKCPHGRKCQ